MTFWETHQQYNRNKALYQQALAYASDYLSAVRDRHVYPTDSAIDRLQDLNEPMPDDPTESMDVLAMLHEIGSPATVAQGGGRYFGFVNGGVIPASLAARILADVWDQNAGLYAMSPIASHLEALCERWVVDLMGLPEGTAAGFVSGTSSATMVGLLTARNALLKNQGWDVSERGVFGAPPLRVVMSEQAHGTVRKALAIIGIGYAQIEWVPADAQGRLDAEYLPELDNRTLVILQAGNVNSGAFDPFTEVCQKANQVGAWVHIDGAFGLWAAASASTRHLTAGIALADSWSVDGHKTLNTPYDSGIVLCKDRAAMVSALQASGSYLQFSDARDNMLYAPEMSRRARGVDMWALLKTLGRRGVDTMIAQLHDRAKLFAELLPQHGFRVLNDVVFNQVVVVCDTPELTQATLAQIQQDGVCWCSGSQWQDEPIIRVSVCSWATTEDDVKLSVEAFAQAYYTVKSS